LNEDAAVLHPLKAFASSTRPGVNQTKRRVTADPKNQAE
jgi:hypothetical protein